MKESEEISFKIPAGVAQGMQLTVQGKGNAAKSGGINGDLLVVVEEEPDKELQRDGNDLIYSLFVSVPDAILGTSAEIPAVDGKLRIKIEPGTQSGKVLRSGAKGSPISTVTERETCWCMSRYGFPNIFPLRKKRKSRSCAVLPDSLRSRPGRIGISSTGSSRCSADG